MQLPYSNLQTKHWNEGASMPLVLPIHVICNTSDEALFSNIRVNSRRPGKWVKAEKPHGAVAIICGSGPSLADHVADIRKARRAGGIVFAMNGAAHFLWDRGVVVDYQVIIDAREETAQLVSDAVEHLFASQVHPACFDKAPGARVWHLQIGDIDDVLPDYEDGYCLIGGAASVGNTATCLAYAMGYRRLEIYGLDSSHRDGKGHAFHQAMNDGDPCCWVTWNKKQYLCSLTMKLQAEKFQETARALVDAGCTINVHGDGLLPAMWNTPPEDLPEVEKYQRMWAQPSYRLRSPGERCAGTFLEVVKPDGRVIDFGCGTGRGGLALHKAGCDVLLVDFARNCRDPEAEALPFVELDLGGPLPLAPYGFCADVMEHIPPADVERVVRNIMEAAETTFFQISTVPDLCGALINQTLHLTVQPHEWWRALFDRLGFAVTFEHRDGIASQFVVTSALKQRD